MTPKVLILLLVLTVLLTSMAYRSRLLPTDKPTYITSFEACVAAGYPVLESYPPRCRTSDGQTFVQVVDNQPSLPDQIRVYSPLNNQLVSRTFQLQGEARGSWFFEAGFSYQVFDNTNTLITSGTVTAAGDWMTTDYVQFMAQISLPDTVAPSGRLVLHKSNPSGLTENNANLTIPLKFE